MNIESIKKDFAKNFRLIVSGYTRHGTDRNVNQSEVYSDDLSIEQNLTIQEIGNARTEIKRSFVAYEVDSSKAVKIELPLGMTLISGPSNTGKSAIARHIASYNAVTNIRFHEPEPPAIMSPKALIKLLEDFLVDDEADMLVVDSFKFFAYNSDNKASAISGGISSNLFTELTNLSLLSATLKKRLIIVMNFVSENDRNRATIINAIVGSVSGLIATDRGITNGKLVFDYQARTVENRRSLQHFELLEQDLFERDVTMPLQEKKKKGKQPTIKESKEDDFTVLKLLRDLNNEQERNNLDEKN